MKRKLFVFICLPVVIFLTGCGSKAEEDDIRGKSLPDYISLTAMIVFVEDNFIGTDLMRGYSVSNDNFDPEDYLVEAYRIQLTNETKFIDAETGEAFYFDFSDQASLFEDENLGYIYDRDGREVEVKTEEPFTPAPSADRTDYILSSHEFLPIYTAKEVTLYPLTYESFTFRHAVKDTSNVLMIVETEDYFSEPFYEEYDRLWKELDSLSENRSYIDMYVMDTAGLEQYSLPENIDQFPYYFVFDDGDVALHTDNWEEVTTFFSHD
ncbi:hypothetical protein SAMN05421736_101270 [Evansella caseinilytica]|uniref:WG repeat protein n=1 Tax=Evansella caseinilytica TaxID=1503961 RepID=A0A1H3GT90_9BACI|nr:hypothetical protein [Evansella caseinilytica]SDY06260.1 hypothetical protein SAMN05421736_101270 [Evansella caseinilytica]